MSLISMAVYDTEQNGRTILTEQSLKSLEKTVNWNRHRLFLIDNASCEDTQKLYEKATNWLPFTLIKSKENIGTAKAINLGWLNRKENEAAVKCDNDIKFNTVDWADKLEDALTKEDDVPVLGLKRRDCWEHPDHENDWWKSQIRFLNHVPGDIWYPVELCNHVIGSCVMYAPKFLKEYGYMYQSSFLYGYDDAISSARVHGAKKYNGFLLGIDIEHMDPSGKESNLYNEWKQKYSGERMAEFSKLANEYIEGKRPIYQGPNDE